MRCSNIIKNIGQAKIKLCGTNTPAYFVATSVKKQKRFKTLESCWFNFSQKTF